MEMRMGWGFLSILPGARTGNPPKLGYGLLMANRLVSCPEKGQNRQLDPVFGGSLSLEQL